MIISTSEALRAYSPLLTAARLRHVAGIKWGTKRYLDTTLLYGKEAQAAVAAG